jgi:hypothetical protein
MLTIRRDQMEAFTRIQESRLVSELVAYVRRRFPDLAADEPDTELQARLRGALSRARALGIRHARDVYRYTDLIGIFRWNFEEQPDYRWVTDILTDQRVTNPRRRLNRVIDRHQARLATEQHNREAEAKFSPGLLR